MFAVRAILSLSIQLFGGIVAIYLGARVLRRRKNKITISISMFYILLGSAYLLLAVFIFVLIDPITFVAYILASNLFFFSFTLNVIFCSNVNVLRPKEEAFSKREILYMVGYAVGILILPLIPNSVKLDASTDWIPILGLEFSIVLMVYYSITVFVPRIYLNLKVLSRIREKLLKNRVKMFLFGNLWLLITVYSLVLYLAMPENLLYRNIYAVFSFFNAVPLVLIYYGTKEI